MTTSRDGKKGKKRFTGLSEIPGHCLSLPTWRRSTSVMSALNGELPQQRISLEAQRRVARFLELARLATERTSLENCAEWDWHEWAEHCKSISLRLGFVLPNGGVSWETTASSNDENAEVELKILVLKMVEDASIQKVTKCACGCGKWIQRRREIDRYWGDHRVKVFQSSQDVKDARAKEARDVRMRGHKREDRDTGTKKASRLKALRNKRRNAKAAK
jgi:hypothetical protein